MSQIGSVFNEALGKSIPVYLSTDVPGFWCPTGAISPAAKNLALAKTEVAFESGDLFTDADMKNTESLNISTTATSSQQGKPSRISLGPETKVDQTPAFKSYNLVVCGALNPVRDGFIPDFLVFSMALNQKGVGGDFCSCFLLGEHFDYLESLNPPIMDIKFGYIGPNRYLYTCPKPNIRTFPWQQ